MPAIVNKLGPGTLTVGLTGTPVDFTCQVTAARVEWSADAEDDIETLCGDTVPGARDYTSTLSGTIFSDLGPTAGIVEFSWTNKGTTQPFTFRPSMTTGVKQVTGSVVIDPISVGGDEVSQHDERFRVGHRRGSDARRSGRRRRGLWRIGRGGSR